MRKNGIGNPLDSQANDLAEAVVSNDYGARNSHNLGAAGALPLSVVFCEV